MKRHWHLSHCFDRDIMVCNNYDDREFMCSDMADAAWLVGLLNKLENEDAIRNK